MDPVVVSAVAQPGQISLWHLIMQASWPVFLVMVGLAFASVWCWAVIIEKYFAVRRMNSANDRFEQSFWSGQSLEDLYLALGTRSNLGLSAIFMAAMREWKRSQDAALRAGFQGVQKRIEKVVDVQIQKEMSTIEARLLFLATTGAAAPFIGLFGTVWGIMTSFHSIGSQGAASLAVVAPGISEALIATAAGLAAAIPAVVGYNYFVGKVRHWVTEMDNFALELANLLERRLLRTVKSLKDGY